MRTIVASLRYRFVMWALCARTLSSIRMKSGPTAPAYVRTWTSKIPLTYLTAVSVPFSMMWRSVFPWAFIPYHTMTEPLPKTVVFCNACWAKRLFGLLQTLARMSVKSTQNLDSSVKRTGVKSLTSMWHESVPIANALEYGVVSKLLELLASVTSTQHHATCF
jgi:hypothetical protein